MKEDKRTKNLTLRDIHVGDWVQVWYSDKGEYSHPLLVSNINLDGTIGLSEDYEHSFIDSLYFIADIKNIDAIPMTPERLREFGFELEHDSALNDKVIYDGKTVSLIRKPNKNIKEYHLFDCFYMHEYIAFTESILGVHVQWKGGEK